MGDGGVLRRPSSSPSRPEERVQEPQTKAHARRGDWLCVLRTYMVLITVANLIWEIGQLPFYTIWREGSLREISIAVVHCTGGDVIIALIALASAIALFGDQDWPHAKFARVLVFTTIFGALYAVFSEWLNVINRKSWSYSDEMMTLPWIGTGLAPFAQWLILPPSCLAISRRRCRRHADH